MDSLINWKALQDILMPPMPDQKSSGPNWDHIAPMYNMMAEMELVYTYNQINCIDANPEDTVLDVGSGPGRITCVIADRVKSVTAIDKFPKMLERCRENAKAKGLTNVTTRELDWRETVPGVDIELHDIVIASRSVGLWDIEKLNAAAKKYAVMICWANAPSIPPILNELFAGTNPEREAERRMPPFREDRRIGYNAVWNTVYDMGADPNIRIVTDGFTKTFSDFDSAYAWLRNLQPFEDRYLPVFAKNLELYMSVNPDGSVTFRRETKTYVLWWKPIQRNPEKNRY